MAYYVYILYSKIADRHYCGYTSDLDRRIAQHNDPAYFGSKTTKRFAGPWELIWHRELPTRSEAMRLERAIKKRGIERYLTKDRP